MTVENARYQVKRKPLEGMSITFTGEGGAVIGMLSWDGKSMQFEGAADESAQLFFEKVVLKAEARRTLNIKT